MLVPSRRKLRRQIRRTAALLLVMAPLWTALATSPSAIARAGVAAAAPLTRSPFTLESMVFSNVLDGYGLFSRVSTNGDRCFDYVGRTSDGGANFRDLVLATRWNCANGAMPTALTFDGGNGFLYGPTLSVSHDGGRSWTTSRSSGDVVAIASAGHSLWQLVSVCSKLEARSDGYCPLLLETSSNGGRTWTQSPTFPKGAAVHPQVADQRSSGQTFLIRVNPRVAYVVLPPIVNFKGTTDHAELWFTANDGVTWTKRSIACGIDALSVALSAAPGGALIGVCASGPSTGFQPKSTVRSMNEGRTWTVINPCDPTVAATNRHCSSPLNDGYLGSIDAVSTEVVFEVGGRSSLNVTWDGGHKWTPVEPLLGGSDAGTFQVAFLNSRDGKVIVAATNEIATTTDGGKKWTSRIAMINRRS